MAPAIHKLIIAMATANPVGAEVCPERKEDLM